MIWVCQEQKGYHLQEFGLRQFLFGQICRMEHGELVHIIIP